MYLGLFKRGVYRSFNGGDTWYPVNGSSWEAYDREITSIVVDHNDENLVYIATEKGVIPYHKWWHKLDFIKFGLTRQ